MQICDNNSLTYSQNEKCFKLIDEINTHILRSTSFYDNRTVYETVGENMLEPNATNILWRLHMECWIIEATNTHSEYRILNCFSMETEVA